MVANADPVVEKLDKAHRGFILTKRRYPFVVAIVHELERLELRRLGGSLAWDHPVLQLVRDCFDMLVIDLYSVRECLVESGGLLNLLKAQPTRLGPTLASDFPPHLSAVAGARSREESERISAEMDATFRAMVAREANDALRWLAGRPEPTVRDEVPTPMTEAEVTKLINRFRDDTEATDQDRNRVRAHRYEEQTDPSFFQPLPKLAEQLAVFESYLRPLHSVLTHAGASFDLHYGTSDTERVAQDLADLLVLGSINLACNVYGVTPERTAENPTPWYWHARQEYFTGPEALREMREKLVAVLQRRASSARP